MENILCHSKNVKAYDTLRPMKHTGPISTHKGPSLQKSLIEFIVLIPVL